MELISREKVIEEIVSTESEVAKNSPFDREWFGRLADRQNEIIDIIENATIVESRPKGVWVGIDEEPHEEWECSYCGNIINTYMQDELEEYKYCHKCGAKMSTPWADVRGEE